MKTMTPQQAIQRLIERNWAPIQIANELGVAKSTISKIQNGASKASFEVGQAIVNLANTRRKAPKAKGKSHANNQSLQA